MKRRLSQSPLSQMELIFAGKQPISEQTARALETATLVEILLVGDEDIADQIGVVEQIEMLRPDPVVGDVAVILIHGDHHCERVARNLYEKLQRVARRRPGREGNAVVRSLRWAKARDTQRSLLRADQGFGSFPIEVFIMLTFGRRQLPAGQDHNS
jgi:hypothetical protein